MKKQTLFVITCGVVILAFALGAWMFRKQRAADLGFLVAEQAVTFVRPHSPRKGPEDARVYLVEFSDPACETCASFSPILDQILDDHPGKVQLVLRYAPFHGGADDVVRILEAARRQDLFWETLHALYATQHLWTQHHQVVLDRVWQVLDHPDLDLDLDVDRVRADLADPRIARQIDDVIAQDLADAETLFVRKTPGIFVNGRPLDPFSVEILKRLVAEEVEKAYSE